MAEVGEKDPYEEAFMESNTNDNAASAMVKDMNYSTYDQDALNNFRRAAEQLFNKGNISNEQLSFILYSIKKNMGKIPKENIAVRHPRGSRSHRGVPRRQRPPVLLDLNPNGPPPRLNFDGDGGTRRMRKSKKHTHKKHKSRRHKKSKKHRK